MLEEIIKQVTFPVFPALYQGKLYHAINGQAFARVILDHAISFNPTPSRLIVFLNEATSSIYHKSRVKTLEEVNVSECWYTGNIPNIDLTLNYWNKASDVSGILIEQPTTVDLDLVKLNLLPEKDVEGITPYNHITLLSKTPLFMHPTAEAVMLLLHTFYDSLENLSITLIGKGTVGFPLGMYLLRKNSNLYWLDSKTSYKEKKQACKSSEVIISCTGGYSNKKYIVNPGMISENAMLIDVGTKVVNKKLYGDINPKAYEKASLVALPKNGVGKITSAILAHHLATKSTKSFTSYLF